MRDIKFRLWNKETKEINYSGTEGSGSSSDIITIGFDGTVYIQNAFGLDMGTRNPAFDKPLDNYVIMQYTGLKDRNGKEIYEGDILKCDFSKDHKDGFHSIQVIEFYEGSFGSRNKDDHFRIPALFSGRATEGMNLNYFEVIGNIHEHKHLLQ